MEEITLGVLLIKASVEIDAAAVDVDTVAAAGEEEEEVPEVDKVEDEEEDIILPFTPRPSNFQAFENFAAISTLVAISSSRRP